MSTNVGKEESLNISNLNICLKRQNKNGTHTKKSKESRMKERKESKFTIETNAVHINEDQIKEKTTYAIERNLHS